MSRGGLLGTVWRCEAAGTGRFRCPHCGEERGFRRTTMHRRVTVMGRPLIRLGAVEEYVTCDRCGHAYTADRADGPPPDPIEDDGMAEDQYALLAIVAAVIFSDSTVRTAEKEAASHVIRRFTGRQVEPADVDDLLRRARKRWGDPMARLARLPCLVPEPVRHQIVEAAYHVCTADAELHHRESLFLNRIGEALELGPRAVRRAIAAAKRDDLEP